MPRLHFLQQRASDDLDPATRAAALRAIAQAWGGRAVALAFLRRFASDDAEPTTRASALTAIARHWRRDADALVILGERTVDDPDPATRATAFTAGVAAILESLGPWSSASRAGSAFIEAAATLVRRGFNHSDATIRERAVAAFSDPEWLWWGSELAMLVDQLDVPALVQDRATNDPEPRVRMTALAAWVEPLSERSFLAPGPPARDRWTFVRGQLGFIRDQAVNGREPTTRSLALRVLGALWRGKAQGLAFLKERAVEDPAAEVRLSGLLVIYVNWTEVAEAQRFIRERAGSEPDESTRAAAESMLYRSPEVRDVERLWRRSYGLLDEYHSYLRY